MKVQVIKTAIRPAAMLCDDDGVPLPGQCKTVLDSGHWDDVGTITVTFVIDGKDIKFM